MTSFNEWTNTLLYKNIISHTLFLKGWCWLCVRDELETSTDCYIDPSSSSTIAALHPHLGWFAQPWVTEGRSPLSGAGSNSAGILFQLTPTDSNRLYPGYIIILRPPASAVLSLIYTGASLDWRLGRGSIYYNCCIIGTFFEIQL